MQGERHRLEVNEEKQGREMWPGFLHWGILKLPNLRGHLFLEDLDPPSGLKTDNTACYTLHFEIYRGKKGRGQAYESE